MAHLEHNTNGILSIVYMGSSKAVCSHNFDDNAARVTCLELYGLADFVSYSIS